MLEELLDKIKEKYPNTLPKGDITIRELGILQGQQQVVKQLADLIEASAYKTKKRISK